MGIGLLIFVLICLTIFNYRVGKSVLYPPFIFCVSWLLVFFCYPLGVVEIYPIHTATFLLVGFACTCFSVCGWLAWIMPRELTSTKIKIGDSLGTPRPNHLTKTLLLIIMIAGMVVIVHSTMARGAGGSGNFLYNARNQPNNDAGSSLLLDYLQKWSTLAAILFLIEKRDKMFWTMAGVAFIEALCTTSRGPILGLFLSLITVHLVKYNRLSIGKAFKTVRVPMFICLALFIGLIFIQKDTTQFGNTYSIIAYFVIGYLLVPIGGLDYVLQHPSEYAGVPNHSFKFLLNIGASLHLWSYTPPPLLDEFISVPQLTNVYTGFKYFFTDFGYFGVFAAMCVIGFLHTLLYKKAASGSALGLYVFSMTTVTAAFFVFDDGYAAMGIWLDMVMFGCAYMVFRPLRALPVELVLIKKLEKRMLRKLLPCLKPATPLKIVLFTDAEKKAVGIYRKKFVFVSEQEKHKF